MSTFQPLTPEEYPELMHILATAFGGGNEETSKTERGKTNEAATSGNTNEADKEANKVDTQSASNKTNKPVQQGTSSNTNEADKEANKADTQSASNKTNKPVQQGTSGHTNELNPQATIDKTNEVKLPSTQSGKETHDKSDGTTTEQTGNKDSADTSEKKPVQPPDYWTTVVSITKPHPYAYRACVKLPDTADLAPWSGTNVGFRAELPIKPRELDGIVQAPALASRVYTVTQADNNTHTISFDLVIHQDDSPGMRWATSVQPGDPLCIRAPHTYKEPVEGTHRLIVADSAALPAARRILLSDSYAGNSTLLTSGHSEELAEIIHLPNVTIIRVEQALDKAVVEVDLQPFACIWAAGETGEMRALRKYCYANTALSKDNIMVTGYWKRGQSITQREITALRITRDTLAAGGTVEDAVELFSQQEE